MATMFNKNLGELLWRRVSGFLTLGYIDETIVTEADDEVLRKVHAELVEARDYVATLEAVVAGFEIPHPLLDKSTDPIHLEAVEDWVLLAKSGQAGLDFRKCYAEHVPRLLHLIKSLKELKGIKPPKEKAPHGKTG